MIGLQNEKPMATSVLLLFPRLAPATCVCFESSDWFVTLFTSVVIGQSNNFGFDFTRLTRKSLYSRVMYNLLLCTSKKDGCTQLYSTLP